MKRSICDRCKAEAVSENMNNPEGWRGLQVSIQGAYGSRKSYDLCPECLKALGHDEVKKTLEQDFLEVLTELVGTIVDDAVEDNR